MAGKSIIVAASWLGWFSVFLLRFAPSPLLILIEREFNLSHGSAGLIFTSYLLAYASMQIPAGVLSDRTGPTRIIVAGLTIMTISGLAMGLSPTFTSMLILSFLAGTGAGTFYTSNTSLISTVFPPSERGKILGIAYSGIGAGASAAIALGGLLGGTLGWREIFYIAALPGCIAAILFTRIELKSLHTFHRSGSSALGLEILGTRAIAIYIVIHTLILITYFGITSFTPTYIALASGLGLVEANLLFLAFPLSEIFGGLVGGYMAGRLGPRRILAISLTTIFLGTAIIPLVKPEAYVILLLPLIGLMFRAAATALPLLVIRSSPKETLGAILGWYNSVGFIGASIGPYIFGLIADLYGFSLSYIVISLPPIASILMLRIASTNSEPKNIRV